MKIQLLLISMLISFTLFAQKECEFTTNIKDSLGLYKSTKEYLIHERVFGNSQSFIYFSLINADGLLSLNIEMIQKSNDFIPAKCFDKNSKIYIQLNNGKIVTLLGLDQEMCGNSVRNNNQNNRVLSGYFLFMKNSFEDLKNSPISFIRIKFATETIDYIIKGELVSEIDKKTYNPDHFFLDYLKCIE